MDTLEALIHLAALIPGVGPYAAAGLGLAKDAIAAGKSPGDITALRKNIVDSWQTELPLD